MGRLGDIGPRGAPDVAKSTHRVGLVGEEGAWLMDPSLLHLKAADATGVCPCGKGNLEFPARLSRSRLSGATTKLTPTAPARKRKRRDVCAYLEGPHNRYKNSPV